MSSQTLAERRRAQAPRATGARLVALTSLSTLVLAVVTGLQGVVLMEVVGVNARTDGFFVAYSLYMVAIVFVASLRSSAVPLLAGAGRRLTYSTFAWTLLTAGAAVLAVTALGAPVLAEILAGADERVQAYTEGSLPIVGLAIALQLTLGAAATVLGIERRLELVSVAYIAAGIAGFAIFLALVGPLEERGLAWALVALAGVALAISAPALRRLGRIGRPPAPRRLSGAAAWLVGSTLVPLSLTALFVPTLALASGAPEGETTLLTYAYSLVSFLAGFAGGGILLTDMIARAVGDSGTAAGEPRPGADTDRLRRGLRFALLVALPGMVVAVIAGVPVLELLLPDAFGGGNAGRFQEFLLLLLPWMLATLAAYVTIPALFTEGHMGRLNRALVAIVAVQLAVSVGAREAFGLTGLVVALVTAPAMLVVVMLHLREGPRGRSTLLALLREAGGPLAITAAAFALPVLLPLLAGWDAAAAIVAAVGGTALYVALIRWIYPAEWETFLSIGSRRLAARP